MKPGDRVSIDAVLRAVFNDCVVVSLPPAPGASGDAATLPLSAVHEQPAPPAPENGSEAAETLTQQGSSAALKTAPEAEDGSGADHVLRLRIVASTFENYDVNDFAQEVATIRGAATALADAQRRVAVYESHN